MADLRIATRGSDLARAQARWVAARLEDANPGLETALVEVTTAGDQDRVTPVATLTEVGAFVRAIQHAVLDGAADIAVHSSKDLPVEGPNGLISFYPEREAPWDVLCGHDPESLPPGAKIGTGSPRRAAQLKSLRPDLVVADIRGNVGTRLEKMRRGDYDAIVLAEAGLRRLGLVGEMEHRFAISEMVPAPGQGALAVEGRDGDPLIGLLEMIDDPSTRLAVETERALLGDTHAGCRSALGALAEVEPGTIRFTGFVEDEAGPRTAVTVGADPRSTARALQEKLGL